MVAARVKSPRDDGRHAIRCSAQRPSTTAPLMIGTKIGQYRVLRVLGEGGMGRVLLVEHVLMKTRHALKVLHEHMSRNATITQRFINEARAAGTIGHRNVVEVTHIDQVEGGGPWYLVMKYLEGQTLTQFLAAWNGQVDQRSIVHIVGEALNGLQAAHDRRVIHRDLKPDNLYLTAVKNDPYRAIILDFGVAQLGQDSGVKTMSGAVIGTPLYMSPEQHRGAPIDRRADIWAMAAIVYDMATGRLPYQGHDEDRGSLTAQEIFLRMMTRPVVDPRHYNPAITEAFAVALLRGLQPDPAQRTASARELALQLALGTPGDTYRPSGRELLQRYADELLEDNVARGGGALGAVDGTPSGSGDRFASNGAPGSHTSMQPIAAALPIAALPIAAPPSVATAPVAVQPQVAAQLPITMRLPIAAQLPILNAPSVAQTPAAVQPPVAVQHPMLRIGGQLTGFTEVPASIQRREVRAMPDTVPVAPAELSTLGATASQLVSRMQPGRRRALFMVVAGVIAAVVAGAVASLVLLSPESSRVATSQERAMAEDATTLSSVAYENSVPDDAMIASGVVREAPALDKATPLAPAPIGGGATSATAVAPSKAAVLTETASEIIVEKTGSAAPEVRDSADPERRDDSATEARSAAVRPAPVAKGELKVVVLPWAEVWLDGQRLGQAPILGLKVPAGRHMLRIKNDAAERTFIITVTPSRLTVVDVTL